MKNLREFLNVRESLIMFLREDIGSGDVTTNCLIPADIDSEAQIVCKNNKPAVVCGLEEAALYLIFVAPIQKLWFLMDFGFKMARL